MLGREPAADQLQSCPGALTAVGYHPGRTLAHPGSLFPRFALGQFLINSEVLSGNKKGPL